MNHIKQHLNNKSIVHLSMYIFGAYSAMNIATFFIGIGHPVLVGWFLGIALGIGLISASIYLSKQDYHDKLPFFLLLTAVILLAGLSGQIQYLAYLTHIETAPYAFFLGFAPPFIVELGLALAVSFAEKSEKTKMLRDSKTQIKNSVAEGMATVFTNIDTARIQRKIEKKVDAVIEYQVDIALAELMPTNVDEKRQKMDKLIDEIADDLTTIADSPSLPTTETPVDADFETQRDSLNAGRKDKKQAELKRFADFLAQHYAGCRTDELNKTQIAKDFGKSARTIDRYIAELTQMDIINGHIEKDLIAQM